MSDTKETPFRKITPADLADPHLHNLNYTVGTLFRELGIATGVVPGSENNLATQGEKLAYVQTKLASVAGSMKPPALPTSVTIAEKVDSRRLVKNESGAWITQCTLQVTVTLPDNPVADEWVSIWFSRDDRATWDGWSSDFPITTKLQTFDIEIQVPDHGGTFWARATTNASTGINSPIKAVESATGAVIAGLWNPAANVVKNASVTLRYADNGAALWGGDITWQNPTATEEPNFWRTRCWIQHVNAAGEADPVYGCKEVTQSADVGAVFTSISDLNWPTPKVGEPYPIVRYTLTVENRANVETLQTSCWPGGTAYQDVAPEARSTSGAPPALPSSVTVAEKSASRHLVKNESGAWITRFTLQVTVTLPADPVTDEWVSIELSRDNKATWDGWSFDRPITTKTQTFDLELQVPDLGGTFWARVGTGSPSGQNSPAKAVESATGAAIAGLGDPLPNSLKNANVTLRYADNGAPLWGGDITWQNPTAAEEPNFWRTRCWIQHVDALGNIDPNYRQEVTQSADVGAVFTSISGLNWPTPKVGELYPIARYTATIENRANVETLQTSCWPGGTAYQDVAPEARTSTGAEPPPSTTPTAVKVNAYRTEGGKRKADLAISGTPPDPLGTYAGVHVYAEIPDGSDPLHPRKGLGAWTLGTDALSTEFAPIDCGKFPHRADDIYRSVITVDEPTAATLIRLYLVSFSSEIENALVAADKAGASPSITFTLTPRTAGIAGEEYARLVSGFSVTVQQRLEGSTWKTYIYPTFTWPDDPRCSGVVIDVMWLDPAQGKWIPLNGAVFGRQMKSDGTIPSNYFDTPATVQTVKVVARSFSDPAATPTTDDDQVNTYVPGVTPEVEVEIGKADGVLDLGQASPGTLETAAFAAGLKPVAIGSALPTDFSAYPQGAVFFLTTDNKLYRSTGAAWTKATDGADIVAHSITAGQIQAGAITTTELFAGEILVGQGGGKPTRFRVNDTSGNMIAFLGADAGGIFNWFKDIRIGPDINNPTIYGSGSGVTINGAAFTLNLNGVETKIANLYESQISKYVGLSVKSSTDSTRTVVYPEGIFICKADGTTIFAVDQTNGVATLGFGTLPSVFGSNTYINNLGVVTPCVEIRESAWNTQPLSIGVYRLWIDGSGRLRIKSSAPASDTDGTVVGAQS